MIVQNPPRYVVVPVVMMVAVATEVVVPQAVVPAEMMTAEVMAASSEPGGNNVRALLERGLQCG